jgi:hypothetical protein
VIINIGTIIFSAILCLMLGAFLFAAVENGVFTLRNTKGWRRWLALLSSVLIAAGACGFFGLGLSYVGGLNWLPPSFEWPAGFVDGVLTTSNRSHIVLIKPAGRVQIYDSVWHFVRGWPAGAALKLHLLADGNVEVLMKGQWSFVFDLNGKLISQRRYGVHEFIDLENSLPAGESVFVPTSPWLYIFSSPLLSWLVGAAGYFVARRRSLESNAAKGRNAVS